MVEHNYSPESLARQRADAVRAHAAGDMPAASALRDEVLRHTDPKDPTYGGVLTTKAASSDREGVPVDATLPIAEEAALILDRQLRQGSPEAKAIAQREYPIAVMYSGALAVKRGVQRLMSGDRGGGEQVHQGRQRLDKSWSDIVKVTGFRHQHPLNFSRRVSIGRSMDGSPLTGLGFAILAGVYAPFSESPKVLKGTSELSSRSEKLHAKKKALLGAGAAGAIAVLSTIPAEKAKMSARRLTNKVI